MKKALRDFGLMAGLQTRQSLYHKREAIGAIVVWGLRLAVTILLYQGVYAIIGQSSVKGITLGTAVTGMVIYCILNGFGGREMTHLVDSEYKMGVIEMWLNKPVSYLILKMAENFGKNISVAFSLAAVGTCFLHFGGFIPNDGFVMERALWGVVLMLLGVVILNLLFTMIGMSVIFLHDSRGVYMINDKLLMTFGGIYIPVGFFPDGLRLVGETLPTGAATYAAQIFYPDFFDNLPRFLVVQVIWIALLGWGLYRLGKASDKHMAVNGG